jgi:hypothetical protein
MTQSREKQEMALPGYSFSNVTMFLCFSKIFAEMKNVSLSQSLSLRFLMLVSSARSWDEYYASKEECKYKK